MPILKRVLLRGFPSNIAVDIALGSVQAWLVEHPNNSLDRIIFNTFTDNLLSLSNPSMRMTLVR